MTSWIDGFNEGYNMASKHADAWIVIFSMLFFIFGIFIGWIGRCVI